MFVLAGVFALRLVLCFYGYDRRPLLTTPDEAIVQDAAVALARGEGWRATSFEGLEIADLYANHPPLFVLVQGAIFKCFGFSPATLRLPGIVESLLATLLLGAILRSLLTAGLVDRFGALLAALLLLADPFVIVLARIGRMEHLAALLALAGLALVAGAVRGPQSSRRWLSAGALLGASCATHPAAVLYVIFFVALLWLRRRETGWGKSAVFLAVPAAVFVLIWIAAFGARSAEAWQQLARMARLGLPPTLGLGLCVRALTHHDLEAFKQVGGTAYLLVIVGWTLLLARALRARSWGVWQPCLLALAVAAAVEIAVAGRLSLYLARTMLFVYLGVLHVAIGSSHLPRAGRRVALAGAGVFLAAQMALLAAYFVRLPQRWAAWSPARFDDLVRSIPASAKTASTFELWHAWRAAARPVRIIDPSLPIDEIHWSQAPLSLEKYDAVIFSDATSGVMDAALAAGAFQPGTWSREVRQLDEKHYTIFRRVGYSKD
jgi:4-amino-4-deoxy-L-arabinose transferase-like glycosyltransferase